jgi:hypothetical protein
MDEVWKECPGFPAYSVSDAGRIRRDWPSSGTKPGQVVVRRKAGPGYLIVLLSYAPRKRRNAYVHRLVALAFLGPPPSLRHQVAHENGDAADCRVANLRWATVKENHADKRRHGTSRDQWGEKNNQSRLASSAVEAIRQARSELGLTYKEIGQRFGICKEHARSICVGKRWRCPSAPVALPPVECV